MLLLLGGGKLGVSAPDVRRSPMSDVTTTGYEVSAPLDREFIEQFRKRLLAVWNDHDTTDLPNLVTEDVVWIDPALPEPARGVEGVRQFMEECWRFAPDMHFDLTGPMCSAGDASWVIAPWKMTGTHLGRFDPPGHAPTGRRFDVDGVDVYIFRAEKVSRYQAIWNQAELMLQLGILPGRGSRGEKMLVAMQRLQVRLRGRRG